MDLLQLGKTPITPDKPTGSDMRYEPEYDEIQSEIKKLSSPSQRSTLDWDKIIEIGTDILSQKSKDLMIVSYLAVALINKKGFEGFDIGVKIFSDMIETFWDDLFPVKTKMKGRINAIEWWIEKCEAMLEGLEEKTPPVSQKEFARINGTLEKIDSILKENIEDTVISLAPLKRFLTGLSVMSEEKPKSEGDAAVSDKAKREMAELQDEITDKKSAQRVLTSVLQKIRQVGAFIFREEPENPQSYRLMRIAAWTPIEVLPPATDGKTKIPGPPGQIKTTLAELQNKGEWENLLKSAEQKINQHIFWLDTHFYVANALENLGEKYQGAKEAVCQETALFISRLKGIEALAFSDGTPFASDETMQWLEHIVQKGETSELRDAASGSVADPFMQELKQVMELISGKKIEQVLDIFQGHINSALSKKEELLWRMELSKILIKSKKISIVKPHLEVIYQDMDSYKLEEWDTDLALKVLKLLWHGFSALKDEQSKKMTYEVFTRIAKLSPADALGLERK